jgi:hypothetical protein
MDGSEDKPTKKKRYVFLFNDLILVTKKHKNTFTYKSVISLDIENIALDLISTETGIKLKHKISPSL